MATKDTEPTKQASVNENLTITAIVALEVYVLLHPTTAF